MEEKRILIVCGEPSGDLNAANLTRALLKLCPGLKVSAVGGANLKDSGAEIFCDIKELSALGLFDVLKKLPRFLALKKSVLEKINQLRPRGIILVDFSGFNLRLAKAINKKIPVIYYTSPQVWASRQGRVKAIKKYVHKMLVFFPFEKEFYRRFGIEADFVGHPLLDAVRPQSEKKEFLHHLGLSEEKTTFALLPGSRRQEVSKILPLMLKAAVLIRERFPASQFIIAKAAQLESQLYDKAINRSDLPVKVAEAKTYDCLNAADFCLVASGTATVETAIMLRPFVLIYKIGLLNYLLYRPQVRLPFIGMVNILAKDRIVPEFIQFRASPKKIADCVIGLLENPAQIQGLKEALRKVNSLLGEKGASTRAAQIIAHTLALG